MPKIVRTTGWGLIVLLGAVAALSLLNTRVPQGIVVHHSGVPGVLTTDQLARFHRSRGYGAFYWGHIYRIGYHYIIFPDGHVEQTRPDHLVGAHAIGYNNYIGICLVGNFTGVEGVLTTRPPIAQMASLEVLVRELKAHYAFSQDRIHLHREMSKSTDCPGAGFPESDFKKSIS
jgi:hypothetical protein